jgi:hypothetical protein
MSREAVSTSFLSFSDLQSSNSRSFIPQESLDTFIVNHFCPLSLQSLEHGKVVRPLGAQLRFKLGICDDALAISSFASASVMASVLTISSSSLIFFC